MCFVDRAIKYMHRGTLQTMLFSFIHSVMNLGCVFTSSVFFLFTVQDKTLLHRLSSVKEFHIASSDICVGKQSSLLVIQVDTDIINITLAFYLELLF